MSVNDIINGTDLRVYNGATAIGEATSATLSVTREMRNILTKDSPNSGWVSNRPGSKSATLTVEALYSETTTNVQPDVLFDALNNGTVLALSLKTTTNGYNFYSFSAYCTSFEVSSPVEDNVSYSATFTVSGAVYRGTN
jgi:hypothetical protein